jgi:hypothetical protein
LPISPTITRSHVCSTAPAINPWINEGLKDVKTLKTIVGGKVDYEAK